MTVLHANTLVRGVVATRDALQRMAEHYRTHPSGNVRVYTGGDVMRERADAYATAAEWLSDVLKEGGIE